MQDYLEELRLHDGRDDEIEVYLASVCCHIAALPRGSFHLTKCYSNFGEHLFRKNARRRLVQVGCHLVGQYGADGRLKSGLRDGLQECLFERLSTWLCR